MIRLALTIALLVAPEGLAAEQRPAPPRPGLSWADADSLSRKLEAIEQRTRAAKPGAAEKISVSEGELNSYLNLSLGSKIPQGISDVDVRLDQDRLSARALVDLDQVRGKLPSAGPFNPMSLLGGRVPVEIRGRIPNDEGFGSLELEDVRLGGFSVPVSFLGQIVASATRTPENPQGFDILAPFRLPYSVKRVRLQPGKVLLEL